MEWKAALADGMWISPLTAVATAAVREASDGTANIEGYISLTPMRADLTAHDRLAHLQDALG